MRAGGACSLQQALTPEATAVVKQAVTLARRRGHAQVTPLHVASTMLATSTGLLRGACLRSNSHPFQCRALELCFNVALNRLPAAAPATTFGIHAHHDHVPSISNALIAAFKRAQAHQRRGSIENNQTLLAVKIELDQLVKSILDDPSVSRVMREAGFSSSQVKINLERGTASLDLSTQTSPPFVISDRSDDKDANVVLAVRNEDHDVMHVIENLADKRRQCVVVVGECSDTVEGVLASVIDKLTKGGSDDDVPDILKTLKFINLCLSSFEHEEARRKLEALTTRLIANDDDDDGVVLFLGDLKWVVDQRADSGIEHGVMEIIGKLIHGVVGGNQRIWLLATANLQTYVRCKSGYPSLETVLRLHPVAIAARCLSSTHVAESEFENQFSSTKLGENGSRAYRVRTEELYTNDVRRSSSLPPWLQQYKDENKESKFDFNDVDKEGVPRKWKTLSFSSLSPSSSSSMDASSVDLNVAPNNGPLLCSNNSPSVSASSSDIMEIEYIARFEKQNAENFKILTRELEKKVPLQKEIIPEIATTILKCRSGMTETIQVSEKVKNETWLVFQGSDRDGKWKIAREIARLVFGSYSSFVSIEKCRSFERFAEEVSNNPHRVFLVENAEEADRGSQVEFKKATERGKIKNPFGEDEANLSDAIVIFSCEGFGGRSGHNKSGGDGDSNEERKETSILSFDLNVSVDHDDPNASKDDRVGTMFECVDGHVVFKIQEL